jgi:dihydrolipoamide dehydrogenase
MIATKDQKTQDTKAADIDCKLVVLGGGPGGYSAAFRAADLGVKTVLVEQHASLGGVCLNVGCIPSKALLHVAKVIEDGKHLAACGVEVAPPKIDLAALRGWKNSVVKKLTSGLVGLAAKRKVQVLTGTGTLLNGNTLEVVNAAGEKQLVRFEFAILATGSEPVSLPFLPDDDRIMDSTGALELEDVPKRLLVIGGGIIGLEMATVYAALGSKITLVEMLPSIVAGADPDLVKPYLNKLKDCYEDVLLSTAVTSVKAIKKCLNVDFKLKDGSTETRHFDRILVAVGRRPNGGKFGAENAGVEVSRQGFVSVVDSQMRTTQKNIFAIGDLIGQPMLAHKAVHEGKVAAEVVAGLPSHFDARVIPSVAYTDPEIAWVGVTEEHAKANHIAYEKSAFPWAASGRALSMGAEAGLSKLLFDPKSKCVIGGGIVGASAGELIAEVALAIEMNATAADIALTVHAHPTLSETVAMATEVFEGTITDLYLPKK